MNRWARAFAQRLLRRVGVPGLIGLALLALALLLVATAPQLLQESERLHQQVQAREAGRALQRPGQAAPALPWQRFSAGFPPRAQNAEDLKQVFAAARRNGVALNKGEYQLVTEPNSPFVAYAATFPLHEGYGDIKKFAADVLRSLPHAALEELRLERSDAGAGALEARIRITLIYRAT